MIFILNIILILIFIIDYNNQIIIIILYNYKLSSNEYRVTSTCRLKLGSGVGWRCAYQHFRGAGREPREENFGATLLHLIR